MKSFLTFAVSCSFAFLTAAAIAQAHGPAVSTDTGSYVGTTLPGISAYLGIRYAASPAGDARWLPPTAPGPAASPQPATTFGASCPVPAQAQNPSETYSEDCLFLNVYTPANTPPHARLPVLFWVPGGDFLISSGAEYNPTSLVSQNNIIVVTINYRLGSLGWLAEPSLAAQAPNAFENPGDSGNYGLMDQEFALSWVRRNIASFGGDPGRITLAGQSAGGTSVYNILESPTVGPQDFSSAIVESAARRLNNSPSVVRYEQQYARSFNQAVQCAGDSNAACLRALSLTALSDADLSVFGLNFSPVAGTKAVPLPALTALQTGRYKRVPVLEGTNANEGRLYEIALVPHTTPSTVGITANGTATYYLSNPSNFCDAAVPQICTYPQEVSAFLALSGFPNSANTPAFSEAVAEQYSPSSFLNKGAPSADEALGQIFTDFDFSCKSLEVDEALKAATPGFVFTYEFDVPNAQRGPGAPEGGFVPGSEHTAELRYIFDYPDNRLTPDEQQLAQEMRTYWSNFAKSANPNFPNLAATWSPYSSPQTIQHLVPGPALPTPDTTFASDHACRLWNPYLSGSGPLGPIAGTL